MYYTYTISRGDLLSPEHPLLSGLHLLALLLLSLQAQLPLDVFASDFYSHGKQASAFKII